MSDPTSFIPTDMPFVEIMPFGEYVALVWLLEDTTKTVTAQEDGLTYTVTERRRVVGRNPRVWLGKLVTLPDGRVLARSDRSLDDGLTLAQARQLRLDLGDAADYLQSLP